MRTIGAIIRFCILVIEKVTSELAFLAAFMSTTEGGTYFDRIVGGMKDNFIILYGFVKAAVTDMSLPDFNAAFKEGVDEGLRAFGANVEASPSKVLLAMIATYAVWKVIPYLLKLLRKNVLKRHKDGGESVKKPERKQPGGGKTYEKLYDKQQPPAHTPPVPRTPSGHTENS